MRKLIVAMGLLVPLSLIGCGEAGNNGPAAGSAAATAKSVPAGPGVLSPANTKIEFVGTKPDGKHNGGFKTFSGSITPIQSDIAAAKISIEIDTDSLYADNPRLTQHLKSPDFFEVKKYPKATFVSKTIEPSQAADATHVIAGDLTLHGTTKSLSFPAKVTQKDDALSLESTFTFDRLDYAINFKPDSINKIVTVKVTANVARK